MTLHTMPGEEFPDHDDELGLSEKEFAEEEKKLKKYVERMEVSPARLYYIFKDAPSREQALRLLKQEGRSKEGLFTGFASAAVDNFRENQLVINFDINPAHLQQQLKDFFESHGLAVSETYNVPTVRKLGEEKKDTGNLVEVLPEPSKQKPDKTLGKAA